jgi:hypothetical protein
MISRISLEQMQSVVSDLLGPQAEDQVGWDIDDIEERFAMLNIDFIDFKTFLHERLEAMGESEMDIDIAWCRGYMHAAIEFFLYGLLLGKEEVINKELYED